MMKIDGGCHCGNITYTAEIDPENVGIYPAFLGFVSQPNPDGSARLPNRPRRSCGFSGGAGERLPRGTNNHRRRRVSDCVSCR